MHIAFWSPAWPLEKFQNGIVTYVHWMKYALESRGHRVSIFAQMVDSSGTGPEQERVHLVKAGLVDRARRRVSSVFNPTEYAAFQFSTAIASAILRTHRKDPIDVLEMEESFGWFADVERRISLPVPVKLHGPAFLSLVEEELNTPFGKEKIEREGRALRRASTIISPANHTLTQTVSYYGLKPKRQEHIVNPVEIPADTPLWNLRSCDGKTILCVGRFDLRKGADVLLKAFKTALQERPDLRLVFVGPDHGVPTADGKVMRFQEYISAMFPSTLRDRVDFRGSLPSREVAVLRTQAMMTVVASRWENQGYAVLEAMLQGCPVVCTDAGGCPENVEDGLTGLLARSGDPDSFAAKMVQMIQDPKAAARMGEAARRYVLDEHSMSKVADRSIRLYEEIIRSS